MANPIGLLIAAIVVLIGVIVLMFLVAVMSWPYAPEQVPVRWDLQGEITRLGSKVEGLLLLPSLALAVYLFLLILPWLDRARAGPGRLARVYQVVRFTLLGLIALAYASVLLWLLA